MSITYITVLGAVLNPFFSLITLAVQNASLSIVMHYSRVSVSPSEKYSAASAVLMVELLKGSISFAIALSRVDDTPGILDNAVPQSKSRKRSTSFPPSRPLVPAWIPTFDYALWRRRVSRLRREIISSDCWKLSIPAVLYVIQNNLQFVAASNLDVATFQVTYQMKILTTAAFSVLMLGKRLTMTKWLSLLFLAIGVGIVQIQSGSPSHAAKPSPDVLLDTAASALNGTTEAVIETVQSAHEAAMNPFIGFLAVSMACMTSGLAGVYFEMVLKGSKADLWVRNVQLSMFSILPALAPILFSGNGVGSASSGGWISFGFLKNFGFWAWFTVLIQVFGGLITAIVIKYSDNIMKGFATSLSIVISFLASVVLFDFQITPTFIVGASTVLAATAAYNTPAKPPSSASAGGTTNGGLGLSINPLKKSTDGSPHGTLMSPTSPNAPIIGGHAMYKDKKRSSIASLKGLVSSLGLGSPTSASSTAFKDGAFSSSAFTRSSSSASLDNNYNDNILPNGMDPTRYSSSGSGYHTPHSAPPPRTPSNDLYAVANSNPRYSPYGAHTPPLPSSSNANGYATPSPAHAHASRAPSLRAPSPLPSSHVLPSSEYLTVGGGGPKKTREKEEASAIAGRRPQPQPTSNGWRMSE